MPTKPRRAGASSEVQILLGLSRQQEAAISKAAARCAVKSVNAAGEERSRPMTRAEFIRQSAYANALAVLK